MQFNNIEITDIHITKYKGETKFLAFARVFFNNIFIVNGFRIIQGNKGPFVAFPQDLNALKKGQEICTTSDKAFRKYIQAQVLEQYAILTEIDAAR